MAYFICEQCGVVDSTANTNYWTRTAAQKPPLCSLCDPGIRHWHGLFKRRSYGEKDYRPDVLNPPRPLYKPLAEPEGETDG